MSSITKSIQNEYVLLMENAFSEKYKYAFRNLELKELRRFILKELISSPELDNQLTNLIVLLNKFWDTHAAALITEVRASKSYRLLLPIQRLGYNISNHLRSLGIYFDSIIMVDPLHFPSLSSLHSFLSLPPDNSYVRMRRLVLLEHVSNLFRAIPFMTIDDDYPIFLIPNYPPVHANAVLTGLPFFPGSCFDRQIFQCIVSIITIWTPANYLRSKKHGRV